MKILEQIMLLPLLSEDIKVAVTFIRLVVDTNLGDFFLISSSPLA